MGTQFGRLSVLIMMRLRFFIISFSIVAIIGFLSIEQAQAQFYFGKNKIQYTNFNWQVMTTEHFKIYFYPSELELAEIAAWSAEESYKRLASLFNYEIYEPIPLIIYSNPNYFVQTNTTFYFLPENVAGFTEHMKGRVVVPFNGSYSDFNKVIWHEMVHVFTFAKIGQTMQDYGRMASAFPPQWFIEGLANYWSREWDSEGDMVLRDMVINGNLPSIRNIWIYNNTYYVYKLGESICHFIADEYGEDKITELFENWSVGKTFDDVVTFTLGHNLNELSEKWSYYLKKKYFPQIANLDLPDKRATRLTNRIFAVRPVPVTLTNENGIEEPWVIYKANKVGYSAIYMQPAKGESKKVITLLKGERSAKYESLHLLSSGVDQFDDKLLAFASKSQERDVLYIYDLDHRKVITKYEFENLIGLVSPRFSPQGDRVVFTGYQLSGYADIYMIHLESGELTQLTDDLYNDLDPSFGCKGNSIIFSSDRGGYGSEGYLSLYRINLDDRRLRRITFGKCHDRYPSESPDGQQLIFSSDRGEERSFNIFSLEHGRKLSKVTEYLTGAFDPRFNKNGEEVYFYAYQNRGFHLFRSDINTMKTVPVDEKENIEVRWIPQKIGTEARESTVKYKTDYSLDIAQSTVAYDGVYGTIGGIQAAVSDMLGNNMWIFLLSNTAQSKDDILTSFNVGVTYLRRTNRLNWGVGAFHLYDEYYNDFDGFYFERLIGGVGLLSYPLTKFDRIETSLFLRYSDKERFAGLQRRQALPATQLFSFITDNTLWEPLGPIEGRRLNLTVGLSYDLNSAETFNRLASIDFRHYLRLGNRSSFASRFFAYSSAGTEPQRIYLGGSWSFRGLSRRHFYNRNILFNSMELRFPLISNLIIGFPIGAMKFSGIQGALFHDAGTAWDDNWIGWRGSFGASIRVALGYLVVLRFDFSRIHNFHGISKSTRTDFFFGWNF